MKTLKLSIFLCLSLCLSGCTQMLIKNINEAGIDQDPEYESTELFEPIKTNESTITPPLSLDKDEWDWDSDQSCNGFEQPEDCDKITWPISYGCRIAEKHQCYQCLAEKTLNPQICEYINIENKTSENFWKDNCYWRLVVKLTKTNKNQITFCNKFTESGRKKACNEITTYKNPTKPNSNPQK